jgi:hypothetical protein
MAGSLKANLSSLEIAHLQAAESAILNFLSGILVVLAKRKLLSPEEVSILYENVSKPLQLLEVANNPLVQEIQQHLDETFSAVQKYIKVS